MGRISICHSLRNIRSPCSESGEREGSWNNSIIHKKSAVGGGTELHTLSFWPKMCPSSCGYAVEKRLQMSLDKASIRREFALSTLSVVIKYYLRVLGRSPGNAEHHTAAIISSMAP